MFDQQRKLAAGQRLPDRLRDLRLSEARTKAQAEGTSPEMFSDVKVIHIGAPVAMIGLTVNISQSITQTTFAPDNKYEHSKTVVREEKKPQEETPKKSCWSCFGC